MLCLGKGPLVFFFFSQVCIGEVTQSLRNVSLETYLFLLGVFGKKKSNM